MVRELWELHPAASKQTMPSCSGDIPGRWPRRAARSDLDVGFRERNFTKAGTSVASTALTRSEPARTRFRSPRKRYHRVIASDPQQHISMLRILYATCKTTLDSLRAASNPLDTAFVAELERITERTFQELKALERTLRAATDAPQSG